MLPSNDLKNLNPGGNGANFQDEIIIEDEKGQEKDGWLQIIIKSSTFCRRNKSLFFLVPRAYVLYNYRELSSVLKVKDV